MSRVVDDPAGHWRDGSAGMGPQRLAPTEREAPPGGPMAALVGPQLSRDEVEEALQRAWDGEADRVDVDAARERGRVFPVPRLVGLIVTGKQLRGLGAALGTALADELGGTWPKTIWLGPVLKYRIVHEFVPAPTDSTTMTPMGLELFGHVSVDGWPQDREHRDESLDEALLAAGPATLRIGSAHWSNYASRVGVPFYM